MWPTERAPSQRSMVQNTVYDSDTWTSFPAVTSHSAPPTGRVPPAVLYGVAGSASRCRGFGRTRTGCGASGGPRGPRRWPPDAPRSSLSTCSHSPPVRASPWSGASRCSRTPGPSRRPGTPARSTPRSRSAAVTCDADQPWSLSPAALLRAPYTPRLVLPSPNGSTIAAAASGLVLAACLRNASAVGRWLAAHGYGTPSRPVLVVPAGERWPDGSLRPSLEDGLGAGAVIAALGPRFGRRCRRRRPGSARPTWARPTWPRRCASPPPAGS